MRDSPRTDRNVRGRLRHLLVIAASTPLLGSSPVRANPIRVTSKLVRAAALAAVGAWAAAVAVAVPARAALVHQYTFNDGTAADAVGTANGNVSGLHTSVQVAGSGATAQGQLVTDGTSYSGAGGFVGAYLPATLANGVTGDFTVEQFLTVSAQSPAAWAFSIGKDPTHYVGLNPSRNGGPATALFVDGGSLQTLNPASGAVPTTPGASGTNLNHLVAVSYEASTGNVALYLDGTQLASGTLIAKGSANSPFGSSATANLLADVVGAFTGVNGNSPSLTDASLNGKTDEFRVYNGVQTTAQILADYTAGPVVGVPEPAAVTALLGPIAAGALTRRRRRR